MNFSKIVSAIFEDLDGTLFFLGGSRRFGYSRETSDLDIFLFIPETLLDPASLAHYLASGDETGLPAVLETLHLSKDNLRGRGKYKNLGQYHMRTQIFGHSTDLLIFTDRDSFDTLRQEHQMVEDYLKAHSEIVEIMKYFSGSGKEKYQAILTRIESLKGSQEELCQQQ